MPPSRSERGLRPERWVDWGVAREAHPPLVVHLCLMGALAAAVLAAPAIQQRTVLAAGGAIETAVSLRSPAPAMAEIGVVLPRSAHQLSARRLGKVLPAATAAGSGPVTPWVVAAAILLVGACLRSTPAAGDPAPRGPPTS